jgi:predicted nucleotidyltransferase
VRTARSDELRHRAELAIRALPPIVEEVVLTGSVSRGVADELSDVEMLVVPSRTLEREECFKLARAMGLTALGSWGSPPPPAQHVFGYLAGAPFELIWWPRAYAEARVAEARAGAEGATADALAHGIPLRTSGLLAGWQEQLRVYPPEVAAARIELAALRWGGFAPAGVLTLTRDGDRVALHEWLIDAATRVLAIVFAVNGVWQPTTKRLSARLEPLAVKPDQLAERLTRTLSLADPRDALRSMTEIQLETVWLAPSGPNVDRARTWLAETLRLVSGGPT